MIHCLVNFLEFLVKHFYKNRWYPRFYVLETVARVPYFAYISVLHLYESLGCWRKADWLKVHFAESWNELHHLLIMESLGGDRQWLDCFIVRHVNQCHCQELNCNYVTVRCIRTIRLFKTLAVYNF